MVASDEFWHEVVGQERAVKTLQRALDGKGVSDMSHAWLITGPPGSGRSNIAYRFAAALIANTPGDREKVFKQVVNGTHPDLEVLTTEGSIIKVERAREVATRAHFAPSVGRYRVVIAEDVDRLLEKSSNTLLKALEEPPERTVWLLCAPSEADVLPTIRSRARSLRLKTPSIDEVASLLVEREGVDFSVAAKAARLAQSHIGMAKTLALREEVLDRRNMTVTSLLDARTLSDAMKAASVVISLAQADAEALTAERDEKEKREALRNLGVAEGSTVPRALRSQIKELELDQQRRSKRGLIDALDRVFLDLLTLYRDALLVRLKTNASLINEEFRQQIEELASNSQPEALLKTVDTIEKARFRLSRGITPALVLEALFANIVAVRNKG